MLKLSSHLSGQDDLPIELDIQRVPCGQTFFDLSTKAFSPGLQKKVCHPSEARDPRRSLRPGGENSSSSPSAAGLPVLRLPGLALRKMPAKLVKVIADQWDLRSHPSTSTAAAWRGPSPAGPVPWYRDPRVAAASDRRIHGVHVAIAALENPFQYTAILAISRPQKFPVARRCETSSRSKSWAVSRPAAPQS